MMSAEDGHDIMENAVMDRAKNFWIPATPSFNRSRGLGYMKIGGICVSDDRKVQIQVIYMHVHT